MRPTTRHLSARVLVNALALAAMTQAAAREYTFTTLAGPDESPGAIDGPGTAARFWYPCGVALDSAGNVYVADTLNHTIRVGAPAGWRGGWSPTRNTHRRP
jgi:DNA-binding beta-propeller fold protein YncE